jgi:AcrR family transcriptional regulator
MTTTSFQRARTPDQIAARRNAILDAARDLLRSHRSADVSLGDIGDRVGLAKSNVLRYFDSREAVLLEVLDAEWRHWLDSLSFPEATENEGRFGREVAVATAIADTLAARPLLCELISVMAGVLERNIQIDFTRDFKRRAAENTDRLATLVQNALPGLPSVSSQQFAGAVFVITAGLWPYAHPTETVAVVSAEMGIAEPFDTFRQNFRHGLSAQLVGLVAMVGS